MGSIDTKPELTADSKALAASDQAQIKNRIDGVVIGLLVGFEESGTPLVVFAANPRVTALPARAITKLTHDDIGREIALLFEEGDSTRPLIVGPVQRPMEGEQAQAESLRDKKPIAEIDGERVVLSANQEIVLRCGKGSITLTAAGKIIVRGTYLLNYSSGVNRIKGGSVQIN